MKNYENEYDAVVKILDDYIPADHNAQHSRAMSGLMAMRQTIIDLEKKIEKLESEHKEDQGVIAVWRGRATRAETERDALQEKTKGARDVETSLRNTLDGQLRDGKASVEFIQDSILEVARERLKKVRDIIGFETPKVALDCFDTLLLKLKSDWKEPEW
ncbi:hypothetical protein [Myxococcus phage Mx1]|nr:hypothetical protein [Myxococcus phage Mx1]